MARRRTFVRGVTARRKTSWDLGPISITGQQFAGTASTAWAAAAQFLTGGLTIARIRGHVDMYLNSATASGDSFVGAHGICVITDDANTAGAFPDPFTEETWDGWIWHSFFSTFVPATDAGSWQHSRLIIDSKAMRKVKETDVLIGVTEVSEVNDGSVLNLFAQTRTLFMLP